MKEQKDGLAFYTFSKNCKSKNFQNISNEKFSKHLQASQFIWLFFSKNVPITGEMYLSSINILEAGILYYINFYGDKF